jgi:hypothetical protein
MGTGHQTRSARLPPIRAPAYPRVLDELIPQALHTGKRYANNPVETDHGRLKAWLRPMRGLKPHGPRESSPPGTRLGPATGHRKWDYTNRRRPGRPPTAAAIRKLVIRIAADNPARSHRRVQGELVNLGHPIAASTV